MLAEDRVKRDALAQQFLHADRRGVLSGPFAIELADIALSWCKGHPDPPPADFAPSPAPPGLRWVSCAKDVSWSSAQYRHLIVPGTLTTVCGASASHPEVWRGNSTKPECPVCKNI